MAENKTKPTGASVEDYIDSRANERQRADCEELMALLGKVTGEPPTMWGPSIVGYGLSCWVSGTGRSSTAESVDALLRDALGRPGAPGEGGPIRAGALRSEPVGGGRE